jgi:hypothetical protein
MSSDTERSQSQFITQLDGAISQAHRLCRERGYRSEDCRAAWRILEEWQAELATRRSRENSGVFFDNAVRLLDRWWLV